MKGPASTLPVSNCYQPVRRYCPRKKLDDEIEKVEMGKPTVLHGTIGTGKTFAARHYICLNEQNFAISWFIDVSGKDKLSYDLKSLAEALVVKDDDALFKTIEQLAKNKKIIFLLDDVQKMLPRLNSLKNCGTSDILFTLS